MLSSGALRLMRLAGLVIFAMLMVATMSAYADRTDPVQDAVTQSFRTLDLQRALPHQVTDADNGSSWKFKMPAGALWLGAVMVAAILIYILRDMIPGWRSPTDEAWNQGDGAPSTAHPAHGVRLAEADALAGQGFFVEAMHLLLLDSLAETRRRLRLEIADSLTSREILGRTRLPEDAKDALRGIVTRVELSYFGDHPAARPDYDHCRDGYAALAAILSRSAGLQALEPSH